MGFGLKGIAAATAVFDVDAELVVAVAAAVVAVAASFALLLLLLLAWFDVAGDGDFGAKKSVLTDNSRFDVRNLRFASILAVAPFGEAFNVVSSDVVAVVSFVFNESVEICKSSFKFGSSFSAVISTY